MKTQIISTDEAQGRVRVLYQFDLDDGSTVGPIVDFRPADDDIQAFVDGAAALFEQTTLDVVPDDPAPVDDLREQILSFDDDTIAKALSLDPAAWQQMKAEMQLGLIANQTADAQVKP